MSLLVGSNSHIHACTHTHTLTCPVSLLPQTVTVGLLFGEQCPALSVVYTVLCCCVPVAISYISAAEPSKAFQIADGSSASFHSSFCFIIHTFVSLFLSPSCTYTPHSPTYIHHTHAHTCTHKYTHMHTHSHMCTNTFTP